MIQQASVRGCRHATQNCNTMLDTLLKHRPMSVQGAGLWRSDAVSSAKSIQRTTRKEFLRRYSTRLESWPGAHKRAVRANFHSHFMQKRQWAWNGSRSSTDARLLTTITQPLISGKDYEKERTGRRDCHDVNSFSFVVLGQQSNLRLNTHNHVFRNASLWEQRRYFQPTARHFQEGFKSNLSSPPSDKQQQPPRVTPLLRAIKVPQYGPDADKAVRSLQNARKERARAKTAANVRRALYGNLIICASKFGAWLSSGSSSMMSEFVHSIVDCGNQALLLMGLRDSRNVADRRHPYGYGKSVYFWALVSALGTFFLGAGVSMSHAVSELMEPSLSNITNEVWAVLAMSFMVDGYVLYKTVTEIRKEQPGDSTFWQYVQKIRDPATLAVLLEDGAACLGIVIAIAGISASHATANPLFDGVAGVGISCVLGGIGLALVRVNHRFLIGQGVEKEILDGIENIIKSRRSIDHVSSIQSQWTGPETFSFKAEIDFDGTYLSALLMPRYQAEFNKAREDLDGELEVLLSWYAEDVIRAIEREVRHVEAMIRQKYPGAEYIELEPMSKHADRFAIDDSFEEKLLLIEKEELQRLVRVLYEKTDKKPTSPESHDDNPGK